MNNQYGTISGYPNSNQSYNLTNLNLEIINQSGLYLINMNIS